MQRTEDASVFRSRPVYPKFVSRGGVPALMVAEGQGGAALIDLGTADPDAMADAHVIYIPSGSDLGPQIAALSPRLYHQAASYAAVESRLTKALADAHMGTHLYIAGTEGLIGRVSAAALAAGLPLGAIQAERHGGTARRMQCVHCKGVTEDVTTDPYICSHCGLTLFVRDHYSRRLGAFQGVCVDAETPGIVPPTQEIQP